VTHTSIAGLVCCGISLAAVGVLLLIVFADDRVLRRDREEYWRNK